MCISICFTIFFGLFYKFDMLFSPIEIKNKFSLFPYNKPFAGNKDTDEPANNIMKLYQIDCNAFQEARQENLYTYGNNTFFYSDYNKVRIARKTNFTCSFAPCENIQFDYVDLYFDNTQNDKIILVHFVGQDTYSFFINPYDNSCYRTVINNTVHDLDKDEIDEYNSFVHNCYDMVSSMAFDITEHKKDEILALKDEIDSNLDKTISDNYTSDKHSVEYYMPISGYDEEDYSFKHYRKVKVVDSFFHSKENDAQREATFYYKGPENKEKMILLYDSYDGGIWYFYEGDWCIACIDNHGNELKKNLYQREKVFDYETLEKYQ